MLQRYPELANKVELVVSIVGFSHKDDFAFGRKRFFFFKYGSKVFSLRIPAFIFHHVFLSPVWLRIAYRHAHNAKDKFEGKFNDEFKATMDAEIKLWRINDIRTQFFCNGQMFTVDNCGKKIDLPLFHVSTEVDRYFDEHRVEQHLRVIFSDFQTVKSNLLAHAPTVIADAKTAAPLVPAKLRKILREL